MDKLHLRLFGGLFIESGGAPVAGFKTQKETLLIAYLALAQRPLTRETLANLLWDERDQSQAMSNLRTLLSRLRKVVGAYLQINRQSVALIFDQVWVDVVAFEAQLTSARANELEEDVVAGLETAVSLVVGDFLAGIAIIDNPELELWQLNTSERLYKQHSVACEQLATHYFYNRNYGKGIAHARTLVRLNPIDEQAHQLLMRLLARDGQITAALHQYQLCAGELAQQLGVEPAAETQALYGRLQTAQSSPPFQLPLLETSFVGRTDELRQIEHLLEEENGRLLTIVGMGGSGKTRLALQAAKERKHAYLHGIYFVPLVTLKTAASIPVQIAQVMGLSLDNQEIERQLLQYLHDKELLLLLDNIEHLLQTPETISFIQQLRQNAPHLTLLVTSRQPLRLRAEWLIRLDGLPFPPIEVQFSEPTRYASIDLFAQRATQQGFSIKPQMDAAVNQICRLVEGLPLAIELITATMDSYTLPEIIQLIRSQMDKLAVSFHDIPARHRSIHAVFDYSWQLLSTVEQQTLGRMSLFQGHFTQTAVIQITNASKGILKNLVNKSLLRQEVDGRFSFHTLIRQFVTEKWEAEIEIVQQYSNYYLTLLCEQEPHIYRESMPQALQTIQDSFENTRSAWQIGIQEQQYCLLQDCLPVVVTLPRFLNLLPDWAQLLDQAKEGAPKEVRAHFAVAQATILVQSGQFELALEILHSISSEAVTEGNVFAYTSALYQEAQIANIRGDYHQTIALNKKAMALIENQQFTELEAFCYQQLGVAYVRLGKTEEATAVLNKALARFQQLKQPYCEAEIFHILSIQAYQLGQYEESLSTLQKSLTRHKSLAGSANIAMTLNSMGLVSNDMGDYDAAEKYYREALEVQQNTANNQEKSKILHNLGLLAQHRRHFEKAEQYYQRALSLVPASSQSAVTLGNLGDIAFFTGNYALAKKRYAQGLAKREALQDTRGIIWSCCCNAVTANILGEYEKGQQFSERAIQLAEELNEQPRLAFALTYWGDARWGLGHQVEAEAAYQQVLAIREKLNIEHLTAVPLTRLGQLALEDEDMETAKLYVEQLLPYLKKSPLGNLFISGEAPLLCYRVLAIQGDSRADAILKSAYSTLRTTAEQFTNDAMQTIFLQNVLAHRRLKMLVEM